MASWSRSRGASTAWGSVPDLGLLNTFSFLNGNLQSLAHYSGLRHPHYQLLVGQYAGNAWHDLMDRTVQPDDADTLLDLVLGAQALLQARSPDGQLPAGVRIVIRLDGQLPHPPAPHPKRKPLGGRR